MKWLVRKTIWNQIWLPLKENMHFIQCHVIQSVSQTKRPNKTAKSPVELCWATQRILHGEHALEYIYKLHYYNASQSAIPQQSNI